MIPYRPLTRDDFRSERPPPAFAAYRDRIGAATCAYLMASPRSQIVVTRYADGRHVATVRELGFQAVMNRSCSWWNPTNRRAAQYILDHEQIHFALFELAARALNARAGVLEEEARATASDTRSAAAELQTRITQMLERATRDVIARSNDFDRDTSFNHDPARQREWAERVAHELEATQRLALHAAPSELEPGRRPPQATP